ncbi:hypothetical protein, partial [Streptomyces sp. NPDC001759]
GGGRRVAEVLNDAEPMSWESMDAHRLSAPQRRRAGPRGGPRAAVDPGPVAGATCADPLTVRRGSDRRWLAHCLSRERPALARSRPVSR